jgi:hypothetical protein
MDEKWIKYKDRLNDEEIHCKPDTEAECPRRDNSGWFIYGQYSTPHCGYVGGVKCDGTCRIKEKRKYGSIYLDEVLNKSRHLKGE